MLANSTLAPVVATEIRFRDLIEMYHAAERPQDLDDVLVSVPMVTSVSRAVADRDHRASEFDRFLGTCVKPSDVTSPPPFPLLPWGEPTLARASRPLPKGKGEDGEECLFDESDEEAFNYHYVNPFGVGCDLAKRWIADGYGSLWLRSDKRVFKSRGMIGNGDDFRRGELRPRPGGKFVAPLTTVRVALTNKRDSGGAIANAIRLGQRFPELCEPVQISPKVAEPSVEIERIPVRAHSPCPYCHDPEAFCDCADMATIGRLAA